MTAAAKSPRSLGSRTPSLSAVPPEAVCGTRSQPRPRWRVPTAVLAAVSIVATLALTLTWARSGDYGNQYRNTVWGELGRTLWHPSGSRLLSGELAKNVVDWAGVRPGYAVLLIALCAAAAFAVSLRRQRGRG